MLEYVAIALMIALATLIALIAIGLGYLFGPRKQSDIKAMPYESGMDPIGDARQRFDVKFYLIAILFLVFDVELLFLYPWAVAARKLGVFGLVEMAIFLVILLVGFIYAWKNDAFKWQ